MVSILDKAIVAISPEWGLRRQAARAALRASERLLNYPSSVQSRLDRNVGGRGTSPDWNLELGFDRRRIVDRARALERQNPIAEALLSRSAEAVVGAEGYGLHAATGDPRWNQRVEKLWRAWSENPELVDCRGLNTFSQVMTLMFRSELRDGDVGSVLLSDGTLRIFESDELSAPEGGYFRQDHVDGIELDARGKPIAFHVYDPDPKVLWSDRRLVPKRTRIPAEFVAFLARRQRAGQTRGLSAFNSLFWNLEQFEGSVEAATVAIRMAACLGLIVKRKGPMLGLDTTTDAGGATRQKWKLEPGTVWRLEPDEDVTQVSPVQPGAAFEPHLRLLVRICGTAFGLPLEIVLNDFTQSNYSNARAAMLQARRTWRGFQSDMKRFATRVYLWKLIGWIEAGLLEPREDALEHSWTTPGWQWIDPEAEIAADLAAIDAGFETHASIVARNGHDPERLLDQREREIEGFERRGIPIVRGQLTRDPGSPGRQDAGPAARRAP